MPKSHHARHPFESRKKEQQHKYSRVHLLRAIATVITHFTLYKLPLASLPPLASSYLGFSGQCVHQACRSSFRTSSTLSPLKQARSQRQYLQSNSQRIFEASDKDHTSGLPLKARLDRSSSLISLFGNPAPPMMCGQLKQLARILRLMHRDTSKNMSHSLSAKRLT